jgi:hypothetical protein
MTKLGQKLTEAVDCIVAFNKMAEEIGKIRGDGDISAMVPINTILVCTPTPEEEAILLPDFGEPQPIWDGEYNHYKINEIDVVFKVTKPEVPSEDS